MRKTFILFIIILTISGCKKDESTTPVPKLKNCAAEYLKFSDDNKCFGYFSFVFPPNDVLKTIVSFKYKNDKVIQVTGGFRPVSPGVSYILFSNDVYDSIVYQDKSIFVYTKPSSINIFFNGYPDSPTVYTKDSNGKLIKMVRRDGVEINYIYQNNQITEKFSTGKIIRNFYIENNNLTRITSESGDTSYPYYSKTEILFQDFDTKPNPLKNMYHLSGAFYRSFSENNYSKYTINYYSRQENGEIGLMGTGSYSMPFEYTADGYPKFGEYTE
jgi:hypothetical protein